MFHLSFGPPGARRGRRKPLGWKNETIGRMENSVHPRSRHAAFQRLWSAHSRTGGAPDVLKVRELDVPLSLGEFIMDMNRSWSGSTGEAGSRV